MFEDVSHWLSFKIPEKKEQLENKTPRTPPTPPPPFPVLQMEWQDDGSDSDSSGVDTDQDSDEDMPTPAKDKDDDSLDVLDQSLTSASGLNPASIWTASELSQVWPGVFDRDDD